MTQDQLIREVAGAIVNRAFFSNWKFYVVIFGLSLLAYIAANFLAPYLKKRGEQLARKSDIDKILQELKQTTETAESIKSEIEKKAWITKEFNLLRRQKLEELLCLVYEHKRLVVKETQAIVEGKALLDDIEASFDRASAIHALYFPELDEEMGTIFAALADYAKWKLQTSISKATAKRESDTSEASEKLDVMTLLDIFNKIAMATLQIEQKAKKIMEDLKSL